jgi:hypothetical protein
VKELYNLKKDISEIKNVYSEHKEKGYELYHILDSTLASVNASEPIFDTAYNPILRQKWEHAIKHKLLPSLENQRKIILSNNYKPNKDWWGSESKN